MIPTLTTDRLTLGPFNMAQYDAFHAFCATDRSHFLGGPTTDPRESWDSCMQGLGQWVARGYGAQEAVLAVRDYAYKVLGMGPLMSLIAPENTRSVALAERIGCTPERDFSAPGEAPVTIYRHPEVTA